MKTISYSNLTKKIAGIRGVPTLSAADQILARRFIQARGKQGWEFFDWPDLRDVELRLKLPLYEPGTAYLAGTQRLFTDTGRCYVAAVDAAFDVDPTDTEVWAPLRRTYLVEWFSRVATYLPGDIVRSQESPRRFYFCTRNTTPVVSQTPSSQPLYWYLLPDWDAEFSLDPDDDLGLSEMGSVFQVSNGDPRESDEYRGWCKYKFDLNDKGVLLVGDAREQGMGWFRFRQPVPTWDGSIYAQGTYALDDQVYYTSEGDFFKSLVAGNTDLPTVAASWERVEIPKFLADFIAVSVQADMLAGPDGQMEKFAIEDAAGFGYLRREIDLIVRQQRQSTPMNVLVRS